LEVGPIIREIRLRGAVPGRQVRTRCEGGKGCKVTPLRDRSGFPSKARPR